MGKRHDQDLEQVFEKIKLLLNDLKYGSITIVVQDEKIIQIEKNEKVRLK
ncbi:YezD family protein [Alkalihalobacterium elongatum]|nr:YezD family protein [Alkalihalobacterium elongatum]